jgi:hypothetical protein
MRHPETAHWDWDALFQLYRHEHGIFSMALWDSASTEPQADGQLHALALGRSSTRRKALRIEYLETYPFGLHPYDGQVFSIVERLAAPYGAFLDATHLELVNPTTGLLGFYSTKGFTQDHGAEGGNVIMRKAIGEGVEDATREEDR